MGDFKDQFGLDYLNVRKSHDDCQRCIAKAQQIEVLQQQLEDMTASRSRFADQYVSMSQHINELNTENTDLRDWKESVLVQLNAINLQDVGKVIGVKLGESIGAKILPTIVKLITENTKLRAEVERLKEYAAIQRHIADTAEERARQAFAAHMRTCFRPIVMCQNSIATTSVLENQLHEADLKAAAQIESLESQLAATQRELEQARSLNALKREPEQDREKL